MELTIDDFEVIEAWLDRGIHLVPYIPRIKTPPKGFSWSAGGRRIESIEEAVRRAQAGLGIAFVLNSANACLVDLDCPLPHTLAEYRECEAVYRESGKPFDRIAYSGLLKEVWKAMPEAEQQERLAEFIAIAAHRPAHLTALSTSGRGLHWYYHVRNAKDFSRPASVVEIYANRRLAFITDWAALADFHSNPPLPLREVADFWTEIDEAMDETNILRRQHADLAPPAVRVDKAGAVRDYDYQAYLDSNPAAATGRNQRLYYWVFRAAQLADPAGEADACSWAAAAGLPKSEIKATALSARRAGAAKPYRPFEVRSKAATCRFEIGGPR